MTNFAKQLRTLRKQAGLTQAQAAALIGVSPRQLWGYEAGTVQPPKYKDTDEGIIALMQALTKKK